uniref:hypothetical protein n=1 Tax=Rheinheimera sp. TaxID=1869214 RepID=UPI0040487134
MAKSSRYMQGLLGVIASGRRRKPVYIRQQALVSQLYPIFESEFSKTKLPVLLSGELVRVLVNLGVYEESVGVRIPTLVGGVLRDLAVDISESPESTLTALPRIVTGDLRGLVVDYVSNEHIVGVRLPLIVAGNLEQVVVSTSANEFSRALLPKLVVGTLD